MYDGTPSNSNDSHLSTMLQKLEKCEIKAYSVEIEEIDCHPILLEIKFLSIQMVKKCHFWQF